MAQVATIDDVARRARVSVATVSRALRGLPNVAPSTRERVLAAARDLHYVADPSAARLASGRNLSIGLLVPMLSQWFHAQLYSGVEAVVAAADYDLLPFTLSGPGGIGRFVEQLPFRKRVDGLIVVDAPFDTSQFQRLASEDIPLVTVGVRTSGVTSLVVDNVASARLAVRHLLGLGHTRIALIGGHEDDPFHFAAPIERLAGYTDALRSAGIEPDRDLVVPGNFSLEGGAEAMHRLLALEDPPTAVFACSDEMAIGAMQVVRDAGLRIPEELSVVGFDDHDVAEYVGLTTVRQDVIELGGRGARLLLDELAEPSRAPRHELHPTRLVVRQTTAAPPDGSESKW